MTRTQCITEKVKTPFGSCYAHVSHIDGKIISIAFSSPGKFRDSTVDNAITALAEAATAMIDEIGGAQ